MRPWRVLPRWDRMDLRVVDWSRRNFSCETNKEEVSKQKWPANGKNARKTRNKTKENIIFHNTTRRHVDAAIQGFEE